jgi:hypothetical protein
MLHLDARPKAAYLYHPVTPYTPHKMAFISQIRSGTFTFEEREHAEDGATETVFPAAAPDAEDES